MKFAAEPTAAAPAAGLTVELETSVPTELLELGSEQQVLGAQPQPGDHIPALLQHSRFDDAQRQLREATLQAENGQGSELMDWNDFLLESELVNLLASLNVVQPDLGSVWGTGIGPHGE